MLLCGNVINIKTKALYANGIIFAKIICLNGLVLNADRQINKKVKKFLNSFGAVVGKYSCNINGLKNKFVYLCGEFFITSQEIKSFLQRELRLFKKVSYLLKHNNNQQLQNYLLKKYNEYISYYQMNIAKLYPNMGIIQNDFNLYAKTKVSLKTITLIIEKDIKIDAYDVTISSKKIDDLNNRGITSNIISKNNLILRFKNKLYIKNSIVGAIKSIGIISPTGLLELKFSNKIYWHELKNKFISSLFELVARNKKRDSTKLTLQGIN